MSTHSRQRRSNGHRMSATQLLSFQANLYSQTDLHPITNVRTDVSSIGNAYAPKSNHRVGSKDNVGRRTVKESANARQADQHSKKVLYSSNKNAAADETKKNSRRATDLNWQQASLLRSRRLPRHEANLPAWAAQSKNYATREQQDRPSGANDARNNKRKTSNKVISVKVQLPPLRFSSNQGRSAWKFVLPTPKAARSHDLPTWYDSSKDELLVTLGESRSAFDGLPSLSKEEGLSESEASQSLDSASFSSSLSSSSSSSSSSSHDCVFSKSNANGTTSNDLVNSMIKSFSIYAGPSFSAAAPQACHLPTPSFLARG
jgi:hypothetical protein